MSIVTKGSIPGEIRGDGYRLQRERARQVLELLHRGAGELAWSTRYDVHDGLEWDAKREVWVGSDGSAYDGARLFGYSRGGAAPGGVRSRCPNARG